MKAFAAILLILTTGCASVTESFTDPKVWGPVAAAVVLQIDDMDYELSDQLREHTPLFGSTENAKDWSDNTKTWTEIAYASTALMTPDPVYTIATQWLTVEEINSNIVSELKSATERERPDGTNDKAMPSGHAAGAAVQANLATKNIQRMNISETAKEIATYSVNGAAMLTAWARVEGGRHYPSDVLMGWALGNFIGDVTTDLFFPDQDEIVLIPQISRDVAGMQVHYRF